MALGLLPAVRSDSMRMYPAGGGEKFSYTLSALYTGVIMGDRGQRDNIIGEKGAPQMITVTHMSNLTSLSLSLTHMCSNLHLFIFC